MASSVTVYEILEVLVSACQCGGGYYIIECVLLATNVFFTCISNTWFQSVTSTVFWRPSPCIFRPRFEEYSNGFYRWIVGLATNTFSHACVECSVYQWPSTDFRHPTSRMFSTSTSFSFFGIFDQLILD